MTVLARLLTAAVIAMLAASPVHAQDAPAVDDDAIAVDREKGLAEWDRIVAVLSHPRCANCHVEDAYPRWSGPHYGATRLHAFNITRGEDGSGFGNAALRCTSCHFSSNSSKLHGPPGAPLWHLAPAEMAWWQKSSAEICAQIKDPERNGARTLEDIAAHVRDDPLVGWGWAPGPGREPAPGSAEATFRAIERWAEAGAPCPAD